MGDFINKLLFLIGLLTWGCVPFTNVSNSIPGAVGTTSKGILINSEHLKTKTTHYGFYHGASRRYSVPELKNMIKRVSSAVATEYEGSVLMIGDMSAEHGGFIGGHRSHRTGLDVDFAFYLQKPNGRLAKPVPLTTFDRFGIGIRDKQIVKFDVARNWKLVEEMLLDPEADIQWIFTSNGIKSLLLDWALRKNRDIELIKRAATVLHQPSDSYPHDDHFHVRIYCPRSEPDPYCVDTGPVWPWVSNPNKRNDKFSKKQLTDLALDG
jgi:penicillin-insensitive murein endopeptidase